MGMSRSGAIEHGESEHPFVDCNGRWTSELFNGRALAVMQEYRRDWHRALKLDDANLLKRYKRKIIRNIHGERISPATDLKTIRTFVDGLSTRPRDRFERVAETKAQSF
jgi:hypothetical protein